MPKTVSLESQYLQSYDDLLQILASENQEDCHNFADIEIQVKQSLSKLNIVEINNAAY